MSTAYRNAMIAAAGGLLLALGAAGAARQAEKPTSYAPKFLDLKHRVIWGATCELPDGNGLSFGGEDQQSDDGCWHTHIKEGGQWKAIDDQLRQHNPLQPMHDAIWSQARSQKDAVAAARAIYFQGLAAKEQIAAVKKDLLPAEKKLAESLRSDLTQLKPFGQAAENKAAAEVATSQIEVAQARLNLLTGGLTEATDNADAAEDQSSTGVDAVLSNSIGGATAEMRRIQICLERAADALGAEPPPRALSGIVYDPQSRLYVLFGGDHLDYLTNDTWVFDPAKLKWSLRNPSSAPPPRANHDIVADGKGKIRIEGGYTYTSSTDYEGGQYANVKDGPWTYDITADTWTGNGKAMPPISRTYREGPFDPDFYMDAPSPDAAEFADFLNKLPDNSWVQTKPPRLPRLNRDWGSAVYDPDHDEILRWSGGHCAHGGSDVLMFHMGTNRWELPFPVEFPLGQLYSNTSYPEGYNFNRRPWVTGHTYQNYGYDPTAGRLIFTGESRDYFTFNPTIGDWVSRAPKPKAMCYYCCFYTLTICPTPGGLVAWTEEGKLLRYDAAKDEWEPLQVTGPKLPGTVVDNSTIAYDSKRDRLLMISKAYDSGKQYGGKIFTYDLRTGQSSMLTPANAEGARKIPYLGRMQYDPRADLVVLGATLPPDSAGLRRTPAYDCAGNRWITLALTGSDPNGKEGRNVSLGFIYDSKRNLFWAVDANSNVFVMRLGPTSADIQALQ